MARRTARRTYWASDNWGNTTTSFGAPSATPGLVGLTPTGNDSLFAASLAGDNPYGALGGADSGNATTRPARRARPGRRPVRRNR